MSWQKSQTPVPHPWINSGSRENLNLNKKNMLNTIIHLVSRASVTSSNLSSIWKIPSSSCSPKGSISSSFTATGGRSCASVFIVLSTHLVKPKKDKNLPAVWSARKIGNHCKLMWKRPWNLYKIILQKTITIMITSLYILLFYRSQI